MTRAEMPAPTSVNVPGSGTETEIGLPIGPSQEAELSMQPVLPPFDPFVSQAAGLFREQPPLGSLPPLPVSPFDPPFCPLFDPPSWPPLCPSFEPPFWPPFDPPSWPPPWPLFDPPWPPFEDRKSTRL